MTAAAAQQTPNPRSLNALRRLQMVQEEYQRHKREGLSDIYIWRAHIHPRFCISEGYFRRSLSRNVRRDIASIQKGMGQLEMF